MISLIYDCPPPPIFQAAPNSSSTCRMLTEISGIISVISIVPALKCKHCHWVIGWPSGSFEPVGLSCTDSEIEIRNMLYAWDKCSGLVHWEDPEGWDGEGGRRGDRDGEHM